MHAMLPAAPNCTITVNYSKPFYENVLDRSTGRAAGLLNSAVFIDGRCKPVSRRSNDDVSLSAKAEKERSSLMDGWPLTGLN